ncbi:MAG: ATP-binding protein, partial [Anaerolineales bacterium]
METNAILETHLRKLRIPTFLENYAKFATDAVQNNQDHVRYLMALAEVEVSQREQNQRKRRIKAARFPVLKELADFDFSSIPSLDKARVLDLARGEYISRRESI